jgi:putative drug exporter of the RND superfamily
MGALARIVTGRRSKWLVVLVWIILVVPFGALGAKLVDVTDNRTESFLPADAESTEALRVQEQRFPGGETVSGLVVYRRAGGLTEADQAAIADDAQRADDAIPIVGQPVVPFMEGSPPSLVSPAGDLAYMIVAVPDDNDRIAEWGTDLREVVHVRTPKGLEVYVTGGLGFNADFEEVFGDIDVKVLLVTVVLVVVLLLLIYRSPMIALIPLFVVFIAYTIARGLVYLYAESGATVSDNGATILVVLMFGVGTDYCLLLVSRYREELRRHEDKHDAMAIAIGRTGPAILASGLTVALTMLVLLVATIGSTHSLGPVSAIGVTVAFTAGLTLLPALLTIAGRRGFWPRHHTVDFRPEGGGEERAGVWRRVGQRVLQRPGLALGATLVLFGIGCLGLLSDK